MSNTVQALALSGSTLYAGGSFATVNGSVTRNRLAAFDTPKPTANVTTFNPSLSSNVLALRAHGPRTLHVGGGFIPRLPAGLPGGYDVLRARRGSARRVRLDRGSIAGGALRTRGRYAFVDRRARRGDRYFTREHRLDGRTVTHGPFRP